MVVRVIGRDCPHAVLSYRREIELVIQRTFNQAKGHIPAKCVGIHPVFLNPQIAIRTTMVFPVIVFVVMALKPKKQFIHRCCLVNQYGIFIR